MNSKDSVSLLVDFFSKLEELVDTPLKYLDFCVTLKNSEGLDRKINILSFKLEEDTRVKVFIFPFEYDGVGLLNSRAILYHTEKFFCAKREKEIEIAIGSLLCDEFDIENLDFSFEIRQIELNEFSKFLLSVDKVKKKFKKDVA